MDLSDDLPPPRRPLFLPVVIATVFLTIIGISAGLVLSSRGDRTEAGPDGGVATSAPQPTGGGQSPQPTESGDLCPEQVQEIAAEKGDAVGEVRQVMKVHTKYTYVWICEDGDGKLFYQANNGDENSPWVEGQTALFLSNVVQNGTNDYTATANDGNTFTVTEDELVIRFAKDGHTQTQEVIS